MGMDMDKEHSLTFSIFTLFLSLALTSPSLQCDARRAMHRSSNTLKVVKRLDSANAGPYGVSSPFSLPPFDSLAPIPLPENAPPFCIYPPATPQPPSSVVPTPVGIPPPFYLPPTLPVQNPPPGPVGVVPGPPEFNPPEIIPNPPIIIPGTPEFTPGPPFYEPSPPYYGPPPGGFVPRPPNQVPTPSGPGGFVPSPPVFQPPVVFPPPNTPPPPYKGPNYALWCVAKPTVPDPIIEEAMNYACGSGADCDSIQPQGSCFEPNTLFAHASYAFNSYWQRTKVAGGTCEFGGTAMLVTVDPSYDGCHFVYI